MDGKRGRGRGRDGGGGKTRGKQADGQRREEELGACTDACRDELAAIDSRRIRGRESEREGGKGSELDFGGSERASKQDRQANRKRKAFSVWQRKRQRGREAVAVTVTGWAGSCRLESDCPPARTGALPARRRLRHRARWPRRPRAAAGAGAAARRHPRGRVCRRQAARPPAGRLAALGA